jgi:catechol 2,3-dioxygenase-like lactoylglutathione lyase family enzyme
MKRLHVNLSVADLAASIRFYSTLFAAAPTVVKDDYAKWMLDDPRVNLSVMSRGARLGLDHLGIEVETHDELDEIYARLQATGRQVVDEGETTCCYHHSAKSWITDPEGISWEAFFTTGQSDTFGVPSALREKSACCFPTAARDTVSAGCCDASTKAKVSKATGCCA